MYFYCETWKLNVNAAKTNVVICSKNSQSEDVNYMYNNERLKIVDDFQYLVIICSRKGTFYKKK